MYLHNVYSDARLYLRNVGFIERVNEIGVVDLVIII